MKAILATFGAGLLLMALPAGVIAQNYAIDRHRIDGGGGTSTSGLYSLRGAIGQPAAGVSSGGGYTLTGGFWAHPGSSTLEAPPTLHISRLGFKVRISWPNPSTGFRLQQATSPTAPVAWADVTSSPVVAGEAKEVTLPAGSVQRFFRLYKP